MTKPQNEEQQKAYSNGFIKGNAGMNNSFCPSEYLHHSSLKNAWLKGWRDGQKNAGINGSKQSQKILILSSIAMVTISLIGLLIIWPFDNQEIVTQNSIDSKKSQQNQRISSNTQTIVSAITLEVETNENQTRPSTTTQLNEDKNSSKNIDVATAIFKGKTLLEPKISTQNLTNNPTKEPTNSTLTLLSKNISTTKKIQDWSNTVNRTAFSENIVNREPISQLFGSTEFLPKIYFFSEIRNYIGNYISHKWYYKGKLISTVDFNEIKGNRWRLYSYKTILENQSGEWSVQIVDQSLNLLKEEKLTILPPPSD